MKAGLGRVALDSNILIAVINGEPTDAEVLEELGRLHAGGSLVMCGAAYAELLGGDGVTPAYLGELFGRTGVILEPETPLALWERAGQAYADYAQRRRTQAGLPRRILADFIVGAHAMARADAFFTLDARRYARAFPELRLLTV